ncbi:MAG: hypothetical protein IKM72_00860, partial [Oscillospiraceae bacterium]|nr:hypothetical protein [Oscillospiraceae bacterium]
RGVIDLINYHVPNPIDFFYNRYNFPLCVKGGDSRAMLMDNCCEAATFFSERCSEHLIMPKALQLFYIFR